MGGDFLSGAYQELFAAVLGYLVSLVGTKVGTHWLEFKEVGRRYKLFISIFRHSFYWMLSLSLYFYVTVQYLHLQTYAFIGLIVLLFLISFRQFYAITKLRAVGVHSADLTIKSGVNYKKALKTCKRGLDFLGVGAHKLTNEEECIEAIRRCNINSKPVRFLLSAPDNPLIKRAARLAKRSPDEYTRKIHQSLVKIKELKETHGCNISVRFYANDHERDFQQFRLMFTNGDTCLVSYTAWGKKTEDGSGLPQLQLLNDVADHDYSSFYYPFHQFFERSWADSADREWDFQKYLEE